uniref:Transmembrane protein n=1 Tax=Phycomyces blakesleeanus TaxID=4837 RepID=A0A0K1HNM4_PHYBL|nr:hypothetical protein [Phycomyces blakesleeanus]AKT93731.1 hypothetical protein [Phycomyces blakesleeanus]
MDLIPSLQVFNLTSFWLDKNQIMEFFLKFFRVFIVSFTLLVLYYFVAHTELNWNTDFISTVYCEEGDPSPSSTSLETNKLNQTLESINNLSERGVTHNVNVSVQPEIVNVLHKMFGVLNSSISVYAGAQAASYIPHPYGKAAVFVGTFGLVYGAQQMISAATQGPRLFRSAVDSNVNTSLASTAGPSEGLLIGGKESDKVYEDLKVPSTPQTQNPVDPDIVAKSVLEKGDSSYFVNSVIETTETFNQLLIGMNILTVTGLYVLAALGVALFSQELKLEEKEFIKTRPLLLKFVTLKKQPNRVVLFLLYVLTFLCFLGVFFGLCWINVQLPT